MINTSPIFYSYRDPLTGMEFVPLKSAVAPAANMPFPAAALKTNSYRRMQDLQLSLKKCDDPSYMINYLNMLKDATPEQLMDFLEQLKDRSAWLGKQETQEIQRCIQYRCVPGTPSAVYNADADAFCNSLLGDVQQPSLDTKKKSTLQLNPISEDAVVTPAAPVLSEHHLERTPRST